MRIFAYAWVSADNEDMMHPLSAQVSHIVSEISNKMIIKNMHKLQSQEEYTKKYEELLKRYKKANVEYGIIQDEKLYKIGLSQKLESLIKDL